MWQEITIAIFTVYIISLLIADGAILDKPRRWLRPRTLFLVIGNKWLLECRLCVAFWVTIMVSLLLQLPLWTFAAIYGMSHFISTQERS